MRIIPVCAIVMALLPLCVYAETFSVKSPDQQIEVFISDNNNVPQYRVSFKGNPIIEPSKLGLAFKNRSSLGEGFYIADSKRDSSDETWMQPWGERKYVRDNHNELLVSFSHNKQRNMSFNLRIKVFNDGIGFRYEVAQLPPDRQVNITDELTEFTVAKADKATAWWIPSRGWNRYEYLYNTSALTDVFHAHTPMTLRLDSGVHISIHEAALVNYAGMTLNQRRPGVFKADLTPWSDGIRVKTQTPFVTPWRTVQIADKAVGLLNSDLILNLNEPNKLGDVSWVTTGKYVGIWWGMHLGINTWGSGKQHGATTAETIRYMDFAAKNGFAGVLVEGWNKGWDGDWYSNGDVFSFTESYADFDLDKVTAYGRKKSVYLIGHHETSGSVSNYRKQMSAALDLYQQKGVPLIKTGYVADAGKIKRIDEQGIVRYEWHDGQFMAGEYLHNVVEAAKRKISINTHEPIKATGLRRTYPNWVSREGARGQEFNAWGEPPNTPEHTAILPYTRMLAGPMDFTPGIFNLAYRGLDADVRVKTTLAKQLALYVVLYSPIQMVADLPRHYAKHQPAFQFIKDVPADWENSVALSGEVGQYVVFARQQRDSRDWYLGALSNEKPRSLSVKLDFLNNNASYIAEIYRDGDKANWKDNPYDIVIEKKRVNAADTLTLNLASSGGVAIAFKYQHEERK